MLTMKRSAVLFFAFLILVSALASCKSQEPQKSCREILGILTDCEIGLPAGKFYSLSATESDGEYLSDSLISSLLGGGSYPEIANDWLDCAFYLSLGGHPCEFDIILCKSHDAAEDTARLLNARLSAIKITKTAHEYAKMIENAKVTVTGNYAILIISTDSGNALKVFLKNK